MKNHNYTLANLKTSIEFVERRLRDGESLENIPVLVTTAEPSMGAHASARVTHTGMGFDWENGQFRIATDRELVGKGNTLEDAKPAVLRPYDGHNYYWCPRCDCKINKDDRFCRHCGQRMK